MAQFNSKMMIKNGEYGTCTMTLGALYNAIKENRVLIPKEQRDVKDSGVTYKRKRDTFIAHILAHTFSDSSITEEFKSALEKQFGSNVEVTSGAIQFVGLSIDECGNVYLSDGQHRFAYYLRDFFTGVAQIRPGTDFGNDFLNNTIDNIFASIVLEDGDGKRENQVIDVSIFTEEDKNRILSQRVVAQCIKAEDEEERAALFVAMNTGTQPTQADLDKANFGNENMYQAILEMHKSLESIKTGEPVTFANGKTYSAANTQAIKTLLNAPMRTLVPIIAHAGLLTYLPKKVIGQDYQWEHGYAQTQADQVRNFFKATHHMSVEECNKYLFRMVDDVVTIAKVIYENDARMMSSAKGMKSLLVGQMNALRSCKGMTKNDFADIAADITTRLVTKSYVPVGEEKSRVYNGAYFNNAHRVRSKNELFAKWVTAEFVAAQKEVA